MFKKDEKSRAFFRDMLHYAQIPGVLDQNPSRLAPEVDCFLGNSFDEALISVIAKKHDLPVYRAPHQNGIMEIANASRNELTKESYQRFLEEGPENLEDFNKVAPHTNYAAVTTTFEQYPPLEKDDRSTYPQIIHLHRGRDAALNINERPY